MRNEQNELRKHQKKTELKKKRKLRTQTLNERFVRHYPPLYLLDMTSLLGFFNTN